MIKRTAIIGMGALGLLYADCIAKTKGKEAVSFVMDKERLIRYQDRKFTCNGQPITFKMEDEETVEPFDLVMVAVKYNGLQSAIETMKNCIGKDTIIMSVMNGITSEQILAERYGDDHMIYTVAQAMDAMRFGDDLIYTKMGELHIGVKEDKQRESLAEVKAFFDEINMPYIEEENIIFRMWAKFMLNVGVNQTCMAYGATYKDVLTVGSEEHDTLIQAMQEVKELSILEHIGLSDEDVQFYVDILKTLKPDGMPSMAQDRIAKRKSEVEMFAGTVLKMAAKHGLQTPANERLYRMILEIENNYEKEAQK